ncbi:hypothetical protein Back2_28170 [Nocardioides baekrokdamisoli]|uniref:Uncharacterized protein n=1 Tax=Nocardioides baekrokdamisoli TaxID=1804624 RepID=A0A3G9IHI9_9ACTN|nr:hypothetical protein [Nocardioides baekrokdamisoli]BBH18530.1 hypothetical protein Back2_28170 [Nocardioides baekrokdamisoli]
MTTDPQPNADIIEATEPVKASRPKPSLPSKPIQLAVGVGVISLLVGGGAGFGLAQIGDSSPATSSSAALTLPGTLSGGFTRNTTVDTQIKPSLTSAQTTLGAGTDMALYASGTKQVLVEATRIGGGATLTAGMTYAKVGDAICSSSTSTSGSEAICTRTSGALTVKVTATDQATAAKYVDEIYKAVA